MLRPRFPSAGGYGFYEELVLGPEQVAALESALEAAGVDHEVVTYPGAPHSSFDRKQGEFAAESEDAWRRTLECVARHG